MTTIHDLHLRAQRDAARDGRPRWVVTIVDTLHIIEPCEFVLAYDFRGQPLNVIERVAYPQSWRWKG